MIKYYRFHVENTSDNGISMGEEEHKLGYSCFSTRQVFFNETKVPVENMLSERGNGLKLHECFERRSYHLLLV
jgi:alkylation response protein AidB-like acyl-CoA dehydrogenase